MGSGLLVGEHQYQLAHQCSFCEKFLHTHKVKLNILGIWDKQNLPVVTSVIPVHTGKGGAGWLVTGRGCRVRSGACGGAMESLTVGEGPAVGRPEEMGSTDG